ncbi:glycosyl hydrolase [Plectosphaerella cucumerina]|uniref:Glycosyl hydrolase n=1 Tax=Plectosphaerella cucumerina TaxID=40658 RepID=A0A8K0T8C2_9PEZI|nr:glycosyl hydrolase [Plectosphaerella cucumerina]
MVPWGLAKRASVFFMSAQPDAKRPDRAGYTANVVTAINTLQERWYNFDTGIWDKAWWNSGNAFTMLADFATLDVAAANQLNIGGILRHTFIRAQGEEIRVTKTMDDAGLVASTYEINMLGIDTLSTELDDVKIARRQQFPGFINEFYDDEGWWALGLIRAYDVMQDRAYLDMAVSIFEDMKTGGNTYCNGGIFWNKERKYVNAISNELYLSVAASLANRLPDGAGLPYLDIANQQWAWFKASGMINSRGTINDGLNGSCQNNGQNTWSYNQGVVLGGLVELHRATGDTALLAQAADIAGAAIRELSDDKGILHESCEPNCGADGNQFKGIFVRNLCYLYRAMPAPPRADFRKFILDNADANWASNRDEKGGLGVVWSGPPQRVSGPTHSSALDALVAAVAVI